MGQETVAVEMVAPSSSTTAAVVVGGGIGGAPMGAPPPTSLAPGFRFHPTDEELVRYYLRRKVCGKPFRFQAVSEIDVYKSEPWELACSNFNLLVSVFLLVLMFYVFWVFLKNFFAF